MKWAWSTGRLRIAFILGTVLVAPLLAANSAFAAYSLYELPTPVVSSGVYNLLNTGYDSTENDPTVSWQGSPLLISDDPEDLANDYSGNNGPAILAGSGAVDGALRVVASHENNDSGKSIELGFCVLSEDSTNAATLSITNQSSVQTGTSPVDQGADVVEQFYENYVAGTQTTYTIAASGSKCIAWADLANDNWIVALDQMTLTDQVTGDAAEMQVRVWYDTSGNVPSDWQALNNEQAPPASTTETRATIPHGGGVVSTVSYSAPSGTCTAEDHSTSTVCGIGVDLDANSAYSLDGGDGYPNTASDCSDGETSEYMAICSQATTSGAPADDESVVVESNNSGSCTGADWCYAADPLGFNDSAAGEYQEGTDGTDGCSTADYYCTSDINSDQVITYNYGEYGMDLEFQFSSSSGTYHLALAATEVLNGSSAGYGFQNVVFLDDNTDDVYYSGQQFTGTYGYGEYEQNIVSSSGTVDLNTMVGPFGFDPTRFILMKND